MHTLRMTWLLLNVCVVGCFKLDFKSTTIISHDYTTLTMSDSLYRKLRGY